MTVRLWEPDERGERMWNQSSGWNCFNCMDGLTDANWEQSSAVLFRLEPHWFHWFFPVLLSLPFLAMLVLFATSQALVACFVCVLSPWYAPPPHRRVAVDSWVLEAGRGRRLTATKTKVKNCGVFLGVQ